MEWGLLGPEHLAGSRRTRSLGLGAAVRKFNQLAVPGIGGVWFAKQLFLATLGVLVAERLRIVSRSVKTIEIANGIEALACWCAFNGNDWKPDSRLRGIQKLAGKTDLTFAKLRQPRFYVTQPMRMATVEALVELGFVHPGSQRFNSFRCTDAGRDLVEAATRERPYKTTVQDYLVRMATDGSRITVTPSLRYALSPLEPLDATARNLIRSRLCEGAGQSKNAGRRKNGLSWVSSISPAAPADWKNKPPSIEADHWDDLRLGASFFEARDAAVAVLGALEAAMAPLNSGRIAAVTAAKLSPVEKALDDLRSAAKGYLKEKTDPTEGKMATVFCQSCIDTNAAQIIRDLVRRDDRVLLLRGDDILVGPAFTGRPPTASPDEDAEGPGAADSDRAPVPPGISPRIQNLYLLELDLRDQLEPFLNPLPAEGAA